MGVTGPLVRMPSVSAIQKQTGAAQARLVGRPIERARTANRAAMVAVVRAKSSWSARAWWASQTTIGHTPSSAAASQPARACPMASPSRQVMRQAAMALSRDGTR